MDFLTDKQRKRNERNEAIRSKYLTIRADAPSNARAIEIIAREWDLTPMTVSRIVKDLNSEQQ